VETIQKEIDIELPISAVYRQWTKFEEFPRLMEGITKVRRTARGQLHWQGEILGKEIGWGRSNRRADPRRTDLLAPRNAAQLIPCGFADERNSSGATLSPIQRH
jgi:hypothetical protein